MSTRKATAALAELPTPQAWLQQAIALYNASAILGGQLPDDPIPAHMYVDADGQPLLAGARIDMNEAMHNFDQIAISTMLAGMSAENALKGLLVAQGSRPVLDHGIVRMAEELRIGEPAARLLEMTEQAISEALRTMEVAVKWSARYPAPKYGPGNKSVRGQDHVEARQIAMLLIQQLGGLVGAAITLRAGGG